MADVTIPTRDGQTIGGFVDEVCKAIEARLRLMIPPHMVDHCHASCEHETVGAGDAIGEIHMYGGESTYYRFRYSRDASFRLVLSEPEAVNEVTTYEPAEPPAMMARAVLCDMAPVHAPAADGLTQGRAVQLLRVGPLHDLDTGAHVLDVTDELCAAIAATAAATGFGLPIDHGHALYRAQSAGEAHDTVPLYGRIVALEHIPGVGLMGVPEWTEAGRAMLAASPGLLYLSPTILGQAHDPATGAALPGRALHSVSLTPTPRQNHLETLALSSAPHAGHFVNTCPGCGSVSQCRCTSPGKEKTSKPCAQCSAKTQGSNQKHPETPALSRGDTPGAVAPSQKGPTMDTDVVQLSRTDHAALLARVAEFEANAQKAEADKKAAEAKLAQAEGDAVTLSARLTALETERAVDKARAEVEAARKVGKVIDEALETKLLAQAPADRALSLSLIPMTVRPSEVIGHGGKVEPKDESDPAVVREAVKLTNEKGIEYSAALKLAASPTGGV